MSGGARENRVMNTTQRIISDDYAKWRKVIAAAGIEPECVGHLS